MGVTIQNLHKTGACHKLHRVLSKRAAQRKLAVKVVDRSGFQTPASAVGQTLGRLSPDNLLAGAVLGTGRGIWDTSNPDDLAPLVEAYQAKHEQHLQEDEPEERPSAARRVARWLTGTGPRGQGELMLSAGAPSPAKAVRRVWTRPGISLPGRILGTPGTLVASLMAAVSRGDNYDPWSHTVNSMTNEPAIQAHELGHAADFSRVGLPTVYSAIYNIPFINLFHEARASIEAPKLLEEARDIRERARASDPDSDEMTQESTYDKILANEARGESILSAAYGTYLGSAIGRALGIPGNAPVLITAGVGRLLGYLGKPWARLSGAQRKKILEEVPAITERGLAGAEEDEVEEKIIQLAKEVEQVPDEEDQPQRKAAAAAGAERGTHLARALLLAAGG